MQRGGFHLSKLIRCFYRLEIAFLAGWIALIGAAWIFLALGSEMSEGELVSFDESLLQALRVSGNPQLAIGPPWLTESMRDVTALGGVSVLTLILIFAIAALLAHRHRAQAIALSTCVILARLSTAVFKDVYDRPRPSFAIFGDLPTSMSFPSGHSAAATATYFILAAVIASLEAQRPAKFLAFFLAGLLSILIGCSRVYLGVHWPSDVIAGWCLGAFWALIAALWLRASNSPVASP